MAPPAINAQSNQVLYEMMMFYKTQAEASRAFANEMKEQVSRHQERIHQLIEDNRTLTTANRRGANLVHMKHEAGIMFGNCTDRFADLLGTVRREVPAFGAYVPEVERILLRADFAHHMLHGVNFVDLTADEDEEDVGMTTEEDSGDELEVEL